MTVQTCFARPIRSGRCKSKRLASRCRERGRDYARQLEAEIMLVGLRHMPILRRRILSERHHTQITELTAASMRTTQTPLVHASTITRALSTLPPRGWSRSSRRTLPRTHCLSVHPRLGGCDGRNVPGKDIGGSHDRAPGLVSHESGLGRKPAGVWRGPRFST